MTTKQQYGFPVLTAEEVLPFLKASGIVPWRKVDATVSLEEHLKRELTPARRRVVERFAPRSEVLLLEDPKDGSVHDMFRGVVKSWSTVFTPLPNPDDPNDPLIPLVGEWKHGCELDDDQSGITVNCPSGVVAKADLATLEPHLAAGKREFEEEVGIPLESIVPLARHSFPAAARSITARAFLFFGVPKLPIAPRLPKLDRNERLVRFIMPLSEWLKYLPTFPCEELTAPAITGLALIRMNRVC